VTAHSARAGATAGSAALFVGLCRVDMIQILHGAPRPQGNEVGVTQVLAAGGPATNAAVTFAFLGGQATLLTGVGRHSSADTIRADLQRAGVRLIDAAEADDSPPVLSYLRFTQGTGDPEHSVSTTVNASGPRLSPPPSLQALADESQAVLVDSHHPDLAEAAARAARERGRPCLLDGRTWKQVTPHLLPFADIAVCSANSRPRDRRRRVPKDTLGYLLDSGASWAAITDGPRPIRWASRAHGIQPDIPVSEIAVADTLGAGDVFHGALTYAIAAQPSVDDDSFGTAVQFAAEVAAYSCQTFGTRAWMNSWPGRP
jgi:sugar/nucleoside kinase (ribokinase family)